MLYWKCGIFRKHSFFEHNLFWLCIRHRSIEKCLNWQNTVMCMELYLFAESCKCTIANSCYCVNKYYVSTLLFTLSIFAHCNESRVNTGARDARIRYQRSKHEIAFGLPYSFKVEHHQSSRSIVILSEGTKIFHVCVLKVAYSLPSFLSNLSMRSLLLRWGSRRGWEGSVESVSSKSAWYLLPHPQKHFWWKTLSLRHLWGRKSYLKFGTYFNPPVPIFNFSQPIHC